MDLKVALNILETVGAVLAVSIGCWAAATAQAKVIGSTLEAMTKQPEISGEIRFKMIIGLAMIESLAIYCLLIALVLLFAKW